MNNKTKHTKAERTNKVSHLKSIVIFLICTLAGGVLGYFSADLSDHIPNLMSVLSSGLQKISIWLLYTSVPFTLAALLFYFKGNKLAKLVAQDDDAFEEANRLLSISLIFTTFTFCWVLIFWGISFSSSFTTDQTYAPIIHTAFLVFEVVSLMVLQFYIIKTTKQLAPEKRGNILDANFQKDWYNSCDEAEQKAIGDYSYFTFRIMNGAYPILLCIVFLISITYSVNPFVFLLLGGLWMVQNLSYMGRSYWMDYKRNKQ